MSYTELHIGKLKPVKTDNYETYAQWILDSEDRETERYYEEYNSYLDQLLNEHYDKFIMLNNQLYTIDDQEFEDGDITYHKVNNDGSIDYVLQFYNGGCCLYEALKYEIEGV